MDMNIHDIEWKEQELFLLKYTSQQEDVWVSLGGKKKGKKTFG